MCQTPGYRWKVKENFLDNNDQLTPQNSELVTSGNSGCWGELNNSGRKKGGEVVNPQEIEKNDDRYLL